MKIIGWAMLVLAAGCSGGGLGPAAGSDPRLLFLGAWSNTGGSSTETCPGTAPQTGALPAGKLKLTIADAVVATAVTVTLANPPGCAFDAAVAAAVATVGADKSCSVGGAGTITIKAGGTFTTADGVTLTASFTHLLDDGMGTVCSQVNSVTLGH